MRILRIERADEQAAVVGGELFVQIMAAIRQELGPEMARFTMRRIERRDRGQAPARCQHAAERPFDSACEENDVIGRPRSASSPGRVGDDLRFAGAVNQHFLEFPIGEERHGAAVGRPERKRRPFGPANLLERERIEAANPERRATTALEGGERELTAIGRQLELAGQHARRRRD